MDWKSLISELQAFDLTQNEIAQACGCRQSTISAIARGETNDPRHSTGERLLALLKAKRLHAAKKRVAQTAPAHGAAPGAGIQATG